MELNNIYNIDCMEGMKEFPDNYFELAIVDPPYGIGMSRDMTCYSKTGNGKGQTFNSRIKHESKNWDNKAPDVLYFNELRRVSKNQIIWGGNYFTDKLPVSRGWIYWDKKISNPNNKNFSDGELAWSSFNKILKKYIYDWIGFGYLNNPAKEKKIHPTQKPVALYRWLLQNYAKPGDKILDTHLGSGSSVIACIEEGFEYIGFELDEDYFEAAKKRIEIFKEQGRLFK